MDADVREEIEGSVRILSVREGIVRIPRHVAGRHAIGSELALDAHDEPVFLRSQRAGGVENERQVSALVLPEALTVEPNGGVVVHRTEAQGYAASGPTPGQVERTLVPNGSEIVASVRELVVVAGRYRDRSNVVGSGCREP